MARKVIDGFPRKISVIQFVTIEVGRLLQEAVGAGAG